MMAPGAAAGSSTWAWTSSSIVIAVLVGLVGVHSCILCLHVIRNKGDTTTRKADPIPRVKKERSRAHGSEKKTDTETQMKTETPTPAAEDTKNEAYRAKQKAAAKAKKQADKLAKAALVAQKKEIDMKKAGKREAERQARIEEQDKLRAQKMIAAAEEKRLTEKAAEKKKRGDDVREAERAVVRKKALEDEARAATERRREAEAAEKARIETEVAERVAAEAKRRAKLLEQAKEDQKAALKASMDAEAAAKVQREQEAEAKARREAALKAKTNVPRINMAKLLLNPGGTDNEQPLLDATPVRLNETQERSTEGLTPRVLEDAKSPRTMAEADMTQWIESMGSDSFSPLAPSSPNLRSRADSGSKVPRIAGLDKLVLSPGDSPILAAAVDTDNGNSPSVTPTPLWRVLDNTQTPRTMAEADIQGWIQNQENTRSP